MTIKAIKPGSVVKEIRRHEVRILSAYNGATQIID
jgi:hypothetical protein